MCVIYIQRVDFRGFVTVGLARGNKSYGELSLGASGSRFPLAVPRGGGMCVLYIQRVDFRGFVTVGLARGNKSYGELSPGASGSMFLLSQCHVWEGCVCYIYIYIQRVDFRGFVTVRLARGKKFIWRN